MHIAVAASPFALRFGAEPQHPTGMTLHIGRDADLWVVVVIAPIAQHDDGRLAADFAHMIALEGLQPIAQIGAVVAGWILVKYLLHGFLRLLLFKDHADVYDVADEDEAVGFGDHILKLVDQSQQKLSTVVSKMNDKGNAVLEENMTIIQTDLPSRAITEKVYF